MEKINKESLSDVSREADIVMLTKEQRRPFLVYVQEGKLVNFHGELLNINEKGIYVMDKKGNIFIHPHYVIGKIHHSSILAQAPVAAAGDIRVKEGIVHMINNRSGHYKPSEVFMQQFLEELKVREANLNYLKEPEIYRSRDDFWDSDAPERWGFKDSDNYDY